MCESQLSWRHLPRPEIGRIEQVVTRLTEATQKLEQAKELDKEDASLDAAIATLNVLSAEKMSLLEGARVNLSGKSKALEDAVANVQVMEQTAANHLAAQESMKVQLAKQVPEAKQSEAASRAARLAMESFSSEVEKTREQSASIQAAISSAKGLDK